MHFATGINPWEEWARIEVAHLRGEPYRLPEVRGAHAGVITCLARDAWPDLSAYDDQEVVWRLHKEHHAGLIVCAAEAKRTEELLAGYAERFARDFLAVAPPQETGRL